MLIDTRYNLVAPLLYPLSTLNNQYRPPPCCLANIALFISLIITKWEDIRSLWIHTRSSRTGWSLPIPLPRWWWHPIPSLWRRWVSRLLTPICRGCISSIYTLRSSIYLSAQSLIHLRVTHKVVEVDQA